MALPHVASLKALTVAPSPVNAPTPELKDELLENDDSQARPLPMTLEGVIAELRRLVSQPEAGPRAPRKCTTPRLD